MKETIILIKAESTVDTCSKSQSNSTEYYSINQFNEESQSLSWRRFFFFLNQFTFYKQSCNQLKGDLGELVSVLEVTALETEPRSV